MVAARISLPDQILASGQHLRELALEVSTASFVALLGHNGSGKTTLLKILADLLPYRGEIFFSSPPSYLPQHMPHPWGLTAVEVIAMGDRTGNTWLRSSSQQRALELLNFWELEYCANRDVAELSGGERQLVWLAQIEMQDAAIMLLDEPTQYLDLYYQSKVFWWMEEKVKSGKLIFCATHEIDAVKELEGQMVHFEKNNSIVQPIVPSAVQELKEKLQRSKY